MLPAGREAGLDVGAKLYVRHRPKQTLLIQANRPNNTPVSWEARGASHRSNTRQPTRLA